MPPVTNRNGMDELALISATSNLTERLNHLNAFVKEKLIEEVRPIESAVLRKFNQVFQEMHFDFISQVFNENSIQSEIAYLKFWQTLFTSGRHLFANSEIKIDARNLKETAVVIPRKAKFISEDFLSNFSSALKLSFDVSKFLKEYRLLSTLITELAERCFLEKELNVHSVATRFFNLLGYQGQLLFYYKKNFNISDEFLNTATKGLVNKAIDLQRFFFNASRENSEINRSILKHYFYISFLKTIYKEKPSLLASSSQDSYLNYYFTTNYNPLPLVFSCAAYLPAEYQVTIEHTKELPEYLPETACQSIAGSREQYENWKASLAKGSVKPLVALESKYSYRTSNSYDAYQIDPYAFGYSPQGGGFYISGEVINSTVHGTGYSYWGGDKHNFISTARHEAIHHDNYRTYNEFFKINPEITNFLNRNWNEGLAVLFAEGACSKGYISQDMSQLEALNLKVLLSNEYIGYHASWIVNTYLINNYSSFYADLLTLNKAIFFAKWNKILHADRGFHVWLRDLNSTCRAYGLRDLTAEQNPSVYLDDYRTIAVTKSPDILPSTAARSRIFTPSRNQKQLSGPAYQDYLRLMHAINENNTTKVHEIAVKTRYSWIFNYRDPERNGEAPLHFLFGKYRGNCPLVLVESLLVHGANPGVCQQFGVTAAQLAKQNCKNWSEIQSSFDRFAQKNNFTTPSTVTTAFPSENSTITTDDVIDGASTWDPLTHGYALAVGFGEGVLAGIIDIGIDTGYQGNYFNHTMAQVMHYGLKPAIVTLINLSYTLSAMGPATVIGLEGTAESALFYAVLDYMGAMAGQVVSQLVLSRLLSPSKAFTLFFLFSNLGVFFSEGIQLRTIQTLMNGLLSSIVPIAGYSATKFLNSITLRLGEEKEIKSPGLEMVAREVRNPMLSHSSFFGIKELIELLDKRILPLKSYEGFETRIGPELASLERNFSNEAFSNKPYEALGEYEIKFFLKHLAALKGKISILQGVPQYSINSILNIIHCIEQGFSVLAITNTQQKNTTETCISEITRSQLRRTIADIPITFEVLYKLLVPILGKNKEIASALNDCEKTLYDRTLHLYIEKGLEQYAFHELMKALDLKQELLMNSNSQEEVLGGHLNRAKCQLAKLNQLLIRDLSDAVLRDSATKLISTIHQCIDISKTFLLNDMQFNAGVEKGKNEAQKKQEPKQQEAPQPAVSSAQEETTALLNRSIVKKEPPIKAKPKQGMYRAPMKHQFHQVPRTIMDNDNGVSSLTPRYR